MRSHGGRCKTDPDVSGPLVVWEDYRNGKIIHIDLSLGILQITSTRVTRKSVNPRQSPGLAGLQDRRSNIFPYHSPVCWINKYGPIVLLLGGTPAPVALG